MSLSFCGSLLSLDPLLLFTFEAFFFLLGSDFGALLMLVFHLLHVVLLILSNVFVHKHVEAQIQVLVRVYKLGDLGVEPRHNVVFKYIDLVVVDEVRGVPEVTVNVLLLIVKEGLCSLPADDLLVREDLVLALVPRSLLPAFKFFFALGFSLLHPLSFVELALHQV